MISLATVSSSECSILQRDITLLIQRGETYSQGTIYLATARSFRFCLPQRDITCRGGVYTPGTIPPASVTVWDRSSFIYHREISFHLLIEVKQTNTEWYLSLPQVCLGFIYHKDISLYLFAVMKYTPTHRYPFIFSFKIHQNIGI